jgi:hypothetical protein
MSFVNLAELKKTVSTVVKLCNKSAVVSLTLSKDNALFFSAWLGNSVEIKVPLKSSNVKKRHSTEKRISFFVEVFQKIVLNLPTRLEEVSLEIGDYYLTISGGYGLPKTSVENDCSQEFEEIKYLHELEYQIFAQKNQLCEFSLSEEQQTCFKTNVEIAEALKQAEAVTGKTKYSESLRYINLVCNGEEGEIIVKATDGHRIYQKQLYALDGFAPSIDFLVAPQLGKALSKLIFTNADWKVYQNFVEVVLDNGIKILAKRSLSEILDLSQFEDRSKHITLVVNPHELKSRLSKIKKDVTLHLYNQEPELLAIEYSEALGDGNAVSWVKIQKQTQSVYMRINVGLLMQALKPIKKTTKEVLLRLPRFVANVKNDELPTGFLEFAGNSYLIGGVKAIGKLPNGVRDWLISQGEPIIPESQPSSTKARPVADVLNSRWNGKDWERPELVSCECGSICDSTRIERKNAFKLYDRCSYCGQDAELLLERIDYKCKKCDVNNISTEYTPMIEPCCMNCGSNDFDTRHTFYCECGTRVEKDNLKVCHCDSQLSEELSWHCDRCQETFQEDDLSNELIKAHAEIDCLDDEVLGFRSCPFCESAEGSVEPHITYHCETCESSTYGFYVPQMEPPIIECPECERDISDLSATVPVDVFVVGSVTRF